MVAEGVQDVGQHDGRGELRCDLQVVIRAKVGVSILKIERNCHGVCSYKVARRRLPNNLPSVITTTSIPPCI